MNEDFSIRLLRMNVVIAAIGMKRSWIYQKTKDGEFPKPISLVSVPSPGMQMTSKPGLNLEL